MPSCVPLGSLYQFERVLRKFQMDGATECCQSPQAQFLIFLGYFKFRRMVLPYNTIFLQIQVHHTLLFVSSGGCSEFL
eukprot:g13979.t1